MEKDQLFANRYRLLREQGRGSFGEVWLAQDEQLDMQVAVKVYIALDDRGIEDFKKEYKTAYDLNHPNLLHAHHFDVCDKRPYLVMPYCPNSALSLIGNCDVETLWKLIGDVSSGLTYLHSLDIVHHDIKPDNILRTVSGDFVITDFGISTKMRSTLRRNSTRAMNQNTSGGSLPYMGPEMFSDTPQSIKATDIWAFGVTLYEIITGDLPFFGQGGVMQLNGAKIPKFECEDEAITRLVASCMAKEPWDRPKARVIETMAKTQSFVERTTAFIPNNSPFSDNFTGVSEMESLQEKRVPSSPHKLARQNNKTLLWIASLLVIITILAIITLRVRNNPKPIEEAEKIEERALTGTINGHEWVDLGLPSGLKWATCNIGASTPEEYGSRFKWGETIIGKHRYGWSNYKFGSYDDGGGILYDDVRIRISKYNTDYRFGPVDLKTELELFDDAAHIYWGDKWRMPTKTDFVELLNCCNWTHEGKGYRATSKTRDTSIYFPAEGLFFGDDDDVSYSGEFDQYWSSTLVSESPESAVTLTFTTKKMGLLDLARVHNCLIRPVTNSE